MTGGSAAKDGPHPFTDEARALGIDIWPEAKRRQLKRALDAHEAARREQARAGGDQASGDEQAPTAR